MGIIPFIWPKKKKVILNVGRGKIKKRGQMEMKKVLMVGCRNSLLSNIIKKIVPFRRRL